MKGLQLDPVFPIVNVAESLIKTLNPYYLPVSSVTHLCKAILIKGAVKTQLLPFAK